MITAQAALPGSRALRFCAEEDPPLMAQHALHRLDRHLSVAIRWKHCSIDARISSRVIQPSASAAQAPPVPSGGRRRLCQQGRGAKQRTQQQKGS
jgi:hypothetical protein